MNLCEAHSKMNSSPNSRSASLQETNTKKVRGWKQMAWAHCCDSMMKGHYNITEREAKRTKWEVFNDIMRKKEKNNIIEKAINKGKTL